MTKQRIVNTLACLGLVFGVMGSANAVPVAYEIGSYSQGGYSASWVHGANGCGNGTGPNTGLPLYMCGDPLLQVNGTIEGDLNNGILIITGGELMIGGASYGVGPGLLGAFGGNAIWSFSVETFGTFIFESLDMGAGLPNFFDGEELVLWGQNLGAYFCSAQYDHCGYGERWGIDLYGSRIAVPEPGTLALFGLGLLAMATMRRRRPLSRRS